MGNQFGMALGSILNVLFSILIPFGRKTKTAQCPASYFQLLSVPDLAIFLDKLIFSALGV